MKFSWGNPTITLIKNDISMYFHVKLMDKMFDKYILEQLASHFRTILSVLGPNQSLLVEPTDSKSTIPRDMYCEPPVISFGRFL